MREKLRFDYILLISTLLLVGTGIVMVYSSSAIMASGRFNDGYFFLKKQILFATVGVLMMVGVARINHQLYSKAAYMILGISLISLIAVLIPGIGVKVGGSTRWLKLGPFSIQPSEFAKLAMIIYLASSLAKKEKNIKKFSVGILPHLIITGIMLSLILTQPDMGTSICIAAVVFILLFAAGVRLSHLSMIMLSAAPIVYFLIANTDYRRQRILSFLNPWADPTDSGFQIIQSFYAFGSGGLFGRGLGEGKQKLFYLPEPHTDFIFSVIGEELGLVGILFITAVFFIFIYRGIKTAFLSSDLFSTYLALGITVLIGVQAIIHMGVTVGLLPTKGIPLPFISYGGSSLVVNLISLGILLNISSQAKKG
ncbi:MAG: putative lipid II flippase FtsW [Pseudomonadota bacterium]